MVAAGNLRRRSSARSPTSDWISTLTDDSTFRTVVAQLGRPGDHRPIVNGGWSACRPTVPRPAFAAAGRGRPRRWRDHRIRGRTRRRWTTFPLASPAISRGGRAPNWNTTDGSTPVQIAADGRPCRRRHAEHPCRATGFTGTLINDSIAMVGRCLRLSRRNLKGIADLADAAGHPDAAVRLPVRRGVERPADSTSTYVVPGRSSCCARDSVRRAPRWRLAEDMHGGIIDRFRTHADQQCGGDRRAMWWPVWCAIWVATVGGDRRRLSRRIPRTPGSLGLVGGRSDLVSLWILAITWLFAALVGLLAKNPEAADGLTASP